MSGSPGLWRRFEKIIRPPPAALAVGPGNEVRVEVCGNELRLLFVCPDVNAGCSFGSEVLRFQVSQWRIFGTDARYAEGGAKRR